MYDDVYIPSNTSLKLGDSEPLLRSPRSGTLNAKYEDRFGTRDVLRPAVPQDGSLAVSRVSPRPGLKHFTDAHNPFERTRGKARCSIDSDRSDVGRAGCRTRNPGVIAASHDRAQSADGHASASTKVYRYSTMADFMPSKREGVFKPPFQSIKESPIRPVDNGDPAAMPVRGSGGKALNNYLNDMKACRSSRRMQKEWGPSPMLQKMNDMKVKLGAEIRDESRERLPPGRSTEPGCVPKSPRSLEDEHNQMWTRKGRSHSQHEGFDVGASADDASSRGRNTGSRLNTPREQALLGTPRSRSCNILNHDEAYISSARSTREESLKRSQRQVQADARSQEINQHMRGSRVDNKTNFEQFKARGVHGTGISSPTSLLG